MLIIGIILIIISILLVIYGRNALRHVRQINEEVDKQNQELERRNQELNHECENLTYILNRTSEDINKKHNELNLLTIQSKNEKQHLNEIQDNITKTIDNQKEMSQKAFENYCQVLEKQYDEYEEEYDMYKDALETSYSNLQLQLIRETDEIREELDKIKASRAAAIQALTREKEINANKDDFRLNISELALKDIRLLKSIQPEITNAIVIDKIIWSNYYQPLAKVKFPKIIGKPTTCGIYKITSLNSGLCYIGQSLNCCDRWKQHCKNALGVGNATEGNKLYQAMKEDGLNNFTFEILEECEPKYLDEKEKYYIDLYSSYDFGLNGNKGNG